MHGLKTRATRSGCVARGFKFFCDVREAPMMERLNPLLCKCPGADVRFADDLR